MRKAGRSLGSGVCARSVRGSGYARSSTGFVVDEVSETTDVKVGVDKDPFEDAPSLEDDLRRRRMTMAIIIMAITTTAPPTAIPIIVPVGVGAVHEDPLIDSAAGHAPVWGHMLAVVWQR